MKRTDREGEGKGKEMGEGERTQRGREGESEGEGEGFGEEVGGGRAQVERRGVWQEGGGRGRRSPFGTLDRGGGGGGGKRRGVDRRTDTGSWTELVAAGPA